MSTNTVIQQGSFIATGNAVHIPLRFGVDWMKVYNTTVAAAAQTTAVGVEYYWQVGFPAGAAWEYKKAGSSVAGANLVTYNSTGGFTYYDSSLLNYGVINATTTGISTATVPVVSNSGTNGLSAGQVVRILRQTASPQLGGYDFTVGLNTLSTSTFSLDFMQQLSVAGTTGSWMLVNSDPIFYPSNRNITIINSVNGATEVTFSVRHNYQVGQILRFNVPSAFGMVELNGLQATIIAIDNTGLDNYVTVDIDSSTFTAFTFPLAAEYPFTPASVTPVGENTAAALTANVNILSDATVNQSSIGMTLSAGANSPAGLVDNVIFWQAGSAFTNDSEVIFN